MTNLRVGGNTDAVNVFFDEILNLANKGVIIKSNGKEYPNTDGTIRRYANIDISSLNGDIEDSKNTFLVSLRVVSDSKDELNQFLEILKKLAGVCYIPKGKNTDLQIRSRDKKYSVMISCIDKKSVVKKKLLGMGDDRFKLLK